MEDYEKKYKEALSRAATELETCGADKSLRNMIYAIFPDELKESEDERIRKALVRFHKSTIDIDGIKGADILAWIEKQGKQKQEWSEEDENYLQSAENACEYQYGKNTSTILWLKSLKDRVQPKQEWSEEDKNFMYDTLSNLTELKDRYGDGYGNVGKCIDWLKSLKARVQGKED